jgi:hypothetical protein
MTAFIRAITTVYLAAAKRTIDGYAQKQRSGRFNQHDSDGFEQQSVNMFPNGNTITFPASQINQNVSGSVIVEATEDCRESRH